MTNKWSLVVALSTVLVSASAGAQTAKELYEQGKAFYDTADYAKALDKFTAAHNKQPTGKYLYQAGLAALRLGRMSDAAKYLEEAGKLDPKLLDNSTYKARLAEAKAGLSARAVTPRAPTPSRTAVPPSGPGGMRLSADPVKDRIMRDLAGNKVWVKDYTNTFTAAEVASLQQVASEAAGRGYDFKIIMVPTPPEGEQAFATRLGKDWANMPREMLLVGFQRGAFAYAPNLQASQITNVWNGEAKRAFVASRARGLQLFAAGLVALQQQKAAAPPVRIVPTAQPIRVVAVRTSSSKTTWIIVGAVVGGIILLIIIVSLVNSAKKKAALVADYSTLVADYSTLYKHSIEALDPLGKQISDVQLTLKIVPDDEAQRLADRAEEGYFKAQGLVGKLPKPEQGQDAASAQRAAGFVHQAEKEIEQAETIVTAKSQGKPIDLEALRNSKEGKMGCYFCSKPITHEKARFTVGIQSKGMKMDVTACRRCDEKYEAGEQPEVRMVNYQGQQMHWSQAPGYDPYYDYYHYNRYQPSFVDWMIMGSLFSAMQPSPYVVIHTGGGGSTRYFDYDNYQTEHHAQEAAGAAAGGGLVGDGSAGGAGEGGGGAGTGGMVDKS